MLLPNFVLIMGMVAAAALITNFSRQLWFAGDDWDFLLQRGTVAGTNRGLWAPHYGHWSTGVVIIYRALFSIFGMRSYLPYVIVCLILHLAIVGLMYKLLIRLGASPWIAVVVGWMLAFLGAGAEAYLWDVAMNMLASLFFGLLAIYLYAVNGPTRTNRRLCWALFVLSLMFSAAGVTMVVVGAAFVACRHGMATAAQMAVVPTVIQLIWFITIGHTGQMPHVDDPTLFLQVPNFIWTGLTHAVGDMSGLPGAGPALLVGILFTPALARGVPEPLIHLSWAGVIGALTQMFLAGATRVGAGVDYAKAERYAYVTLLLLLPAVAVAISWLVVSRNAAPRWATGVLVLIIMTGYNVNSVNQMREYTVTHKPFTRVWEDRLIGLVEAVDNGEAILTNKPDPVLNPYLRATLVDSKEVRAALPRHRASAQGRMDAESFSMVGVGGKAYGLAHPADVVFALGFEGTVSRKPGCHSYLTTEGSTPAFELRTDDTGNEVVVVSGASKITTQLVRDGVVSAQRFWSVKPHSYIHIATTAKLSTLRVTFHATGAFVICKQ